MAGRQPNLARRAAEIRRAVGNQLRSIRTDSGVTTTALADGERLLAAAGAGCGGTVVIDIETGSSRALALGIMAKPDWQRVAP